MATYFNNHRTSPFIEELRQDFLSSLSDHPDPLIRAVSQFERAVLQVRAGSLECFEVCWDRDPEDVILALEENSRLPSPETRCLYRLRIGRDLPQMMVCTREEEAEGAER